MAHGAVIETFLVASRYRYIPNTLGRKVAEPAEAW